MPKIGNFTFDDVEWSVYEGLHDNQIVLQRDCPDCDHGVLSAPARFCKKCFGQGFLIQQVNLDLTNHLVYERKDE
jgi:hypothetical protein